MSKQIKPTERKEKNTYSHPSRLENVFKKTGGNPAEPK
jgi:hypothetical protein